MDVLGASKPATRRSNEEPAVARMCAERVHKFSSQYGGESSRGYTASNLAGESCKYPSYGDFSEACVLVWMQRHYLVQILFELIYDPDCNVGLSPISKRFRVLHKCAT